MTYRDEKAVTIALGDDFYNYISRGMLEPPVICLTYKTKKSDGDREVLDTRGYWPKELRRSSQYIEHEGRSIKKQSDIKDIKEQKKMLS